jgi:hypothetical protein
MRPKLYLILAGMMVAVMVLAACTPAATPAPTKVLVELTTIPASEVPPTVAPTVETLPIASYKDATYQILWQINCLGQWFIRSGSSARLGFKNYYSLFW